MHDCPRLNSSRVARRLPPSDNVTLHQPVYGGGGSGGKFWEDARLNTTLGLTLCAGVRSSITPHLTPRRVRTALEGQVTLNGASRLIRPTLAMKALTLKQMTHGCVKCGEIHP